NAAKLLADTGVCVLYHFMVNVPGETAESIKESKETMEKIYKIHEKSRSIGTVVLNQIRLLPKTGSAQAAIDEGAISKNDTLLYPLYYNPAPFQNLRYELEIFLMEHPRKVEDYFCNDIANTPLSSSLITSSLHGNLAAHNHEVMVSEGFMGEKSYEEITEEILNFQPDIMGIHMIYQWDNHVELKAFCKSIKAKMKIKIIVYGFYAAFAYKDVLESIPEVNAVIIGEPETAFTEIAAGKILPSIPSLCYRNENNEIIKNKIEILKNLDSLAQPIRSKEILAMRETNIEGSRGCYNNCTFCYINNYYGKKCLWRGHSVDYISQEIEMLMQNYGKNRFYFTDPNFFGPGEQGKKRCLELAKRLKPYNIKFGIEARVNDIEEKTLSALVDAGLEEILIGLESGSQNCLDRLKKNTTVAQN
ncbi:MAG: radical SAM protein, partial [Clostridiales bacterium]